MLQYPIFDMDKKVGAVSFAEEGLYLTYRAELREVKEAFSRLYFHGRQSQCLGVFCGAVCTGRRSKRSIGALSDDVCFSVNALPWRLREGSRLALPCRVREDGECYAIKRQCIPQEALPYFCFFHPVEMENEPYFLLYLDGDGRPFIP